jgi:hypothetical protein
MSRYRVLCTAAALAIAGCVASAQTTVPNIFENVDKVIPDGQLAGVSDTGALTLSGFGRGSVTDVQGALAIATDGSDVDPVYVLDTGPQTLLLGSFNGTNPAGDWTLFLTDLDFGEQDTLVKWDVIVTAIPEPSTWTLMGLGGFAFGMRFMRRRVFR